MLSDLELYKLRKNLRPECNTRAQALAKFVRPVIMAVCPSIQPDMIKMDASLRLDLNLDAMARAAVVAMICRAFGSAVERVSCVDTVGGLCQVVCEHMNFPMPDAMRAVGNAKKSGPMKKFFDLLAFRSKQR